MLIFGASVRDWKEKADYAEDKADNDFAKVHEVRCEGIEDIQTAFATMAAFAADTRCRDFLYHATINLRPGERLTKEQWQHAVNRLEQNLKLDGHYRAVFEHIKKDRQHYHIIWSRIPPDGGAAVNMGFNFYVNQRTAKELEKEFGLKPSNTRKDPTSRENEEKNNYGPSQTERDAVKSTVTRIYHASAHSEAFIKNLAEAGFKLCRAKNGSYLIVEKTGRYHGLLRRLDGIRLNEFRVKFPDMEKRLLPSFSPAANKRIRGNQRRFKRVARSLTRVRKHRHPRALARQGRNPTVKLRNVRSVINLVNAAKAQLPAFKQKKAQPAMILRKRRQRKDENKPSVYIPNKQEIATAELIRLAWENKWYDVLAAHGIHLIPEDATLVELVRWGVIPPDALEP